MFTTIVVLVPVMFTGGYTQQVMRPLNIVIVSTLFASLLCALTIVPLLASRLISKKERKPSRIERVAAKTDVIVNLLTTIYSGILRRALRHRGITLHIALIFLVFTMRIVVPMLGGELMPPMDTGVILVDIETPTDYAPEAIEKALTDVEHMISQTKGVESISSVVGSEVGRTSFGGGGATVQGGRITVHLVDRTQRMETIWDIQDQWREALRKMPDIRAFKVSEYGATPMSTTKAPLDIIISGPDPVILSSLADRCLQTLQGIRGITDVRRSWYLDKTEYVVVPDPALTTFYKTTPAAVALELQHAVKGRSAGNMNLTDFLDIPITVQYAQQLMDHPDQLNEVYIPTTFGPVPLRSLATLKTRNAAPFITRENLRSTIDITAVNKGATIKTVAAAVEKRLAFNDLPAGSRITVSGTAADMATAKTAMGKAILIGLVLLYLLLVAMFKSFVHPLTVFAAIPLAIAGAIWGLYIFDKPMCQPAMMGLILLGGTIVNNSILMLGFITQARASGLSKDAALLQSVRLRIRPILMTTVSTILGLTPLVFEMAVGLERMSPLGIAAATGLLAGTFLTMVVIPVVYSCLDSLACVLRSS